MSLNVTLSDVWADQLLQRSAYVMYLTLELEVIPEGLLCHAGEHPPGPPKHSHGCLILKNWHHWYFKTGVGLWKCRHRTGCLMHIKSSLPLLVCFEVRSMLLSTPNTLLFQQLKAKDGNSMWLNLEVASGVSAFLQSSCTLERGCLKSLFNEIACLGLWGNQVIRWDALGQFWTLLLQAIATKSKQMSFYAERKMSQKNCQCALWDNVWTCWMCIVKLNWHCSLVSKMLVRFKIA